MLMFCLVLDAPKAAVDFLHLCVGDRTSREGATLSLKGYSFHKVIRNFMIQAGKSTNGSLIDLATNPEIRNDGCSSITSERDFSARLHDANLGNFDTAFNMGIASTDPNSDPAHFFINTYPSPHLNGLHTNFGKVVVGKSTIRTIECQKVNSQNVPLESIEIEDCGIWSKEMGCPVYNCSYNSIGGDIYEEYPDDDVGHFDKEKSSESFKAANTIKESGTLLFKKKNYKEALFKYKKSLRYVVEYMPDQDQAPEFNAKFEELKKKLYLNLAISAMNIKDHIQAITYSTYLLEQDNIDRKEKAKAYYRRGVSELELNRLEEALKDLKQCEDLNPNDTIVQRKVDEAQKLIENQKEKEKQKYAKFFN